MLNHIHYLRGIAILFIVFGHAIWFHLDWSNNISMRNTLADLLGNGSVVFVFVAGFLFQHLIGRYSYKSYISKKIKNVLIPYVLVSIPAITWAFTFGNNLAADSGGLLSGSVVGQTVWYLLVGGGHVNYALWFIPMIAIYYILAPVFIFCSSKPKCYLLIFPLLVVSILIHRQSFPLIAPIRQFFYFLPVYMIGMWASQYRMVIDPILQRHRYFLFSIPIILFSIQRFFSENHGNSVSLYPFEYNNSWVDFILLQKIALCFALSVFLQVYPPKRMSLFLGYLADISFSIFFIHVYFLYSFQVLMGYQPIDGDVFSWFVRGLLALTLTIITVSSIKKICKLMKLDSRVFIGS